MPSNSDQETIVLMDIIRGLTPLNDEARLRLLRTASTYFGLGSDSPIAFQPAPEDSTPVAGSQRPTFSNNPTLSAKEFLHNKAPRTDIERVACLGYYLTHYRTMPHFTTIDINKLNTEAAQLKFSNASQAVANAERRGLLAPALRGRKQISAIGENFVDALPNRESAARALEVVKGRRRGERKDRSSSDE